MKLFKQKTLKTVASAAIFSFTLTVLMATVAGPASAQTPIRGCCVISATSVCREAVLPAQCQSPNQFYQGVQCSTFPACNKAQIISPSQAEAPATKTQTPDQNPLIFIPGVPIPGLFSGPIVVDNNLFGNYINSFYVFFAGVAGILAVVMMMWGGFHYITSAGNPQKMKQGKEIINNAIIGLILLLISYLLLNTINPNLIRLAVPSLTRVPEQLAQLDKYCEAQGAVAIAAAKKQGALCGSPAITYQDATGQTKTCVSLNLEQSEKDKEHACMPYSKLDQSTGLYALDYRHDKTARDLCADNKITPDSACEATELIFQFQDTHNSWGWLKGQCRTARRTGHDTCEYRSYFTCPSGSTRVKCDAGGDNRDTNCWYQGKPRERTTGQSDAIDSRCVDPGADQYGAPVTAVDSICCQKLQKSEVFCLLVKDVDRNIAKVPCDEYNKDLTKNFKNWEHPTCEGDRRCWAPISIWSGVSLDSRDKI